MNMKSILFALSLLAASALQAITPSIAYQGVLKSATGGTLESKTQTIEFRLYTDRAGGTPLWGRAVSVLLDDQGLFNVELSDNNGQLLQNMAHDGLLGALESARSASALFIGLTVQGSSGEISPRQKILTVPFATYAQDVDRAKGDFTVEGTARIEENLEVRDALKVSGRATFDGEATFSRKTRVNADLTVGSSGQFYGYGIVPKGTVVMFWGDPNDRKQLPDGWAVCDGRNGTPDLRDRFIVGAGNRYQRGATGGADEVRLTVEQMPSHTHDIRVRTHGYVAAIEDEWEVISAPGHKSYHNKGLQEFSGYNKNDNTGIRHTGGNRPHENRPPYFALFYIIRVK